MKCRSMLALRVGTMTGICRQSKDCRTACIPARQRQQAAGFAEVQLNIGNWSITDAIKGATNQALQ